MPGLHHRSGDERGSSKASEQCGAKGTRRDFTSAEQTSNSAVRGDLKALYCRFSVQSVRLPVSNLTVGKTRAQKISEFILVGA